MICPRCTVAEISAETHTCVLCGYSPGGVQLQVEARDALDEAAHEELAGQFDIETVVAQDPHSVVYVARETSTDRRVTLWVLPRRLFREAQLEERFQKEMSAATVLDHPHVVAVLRFGSTANLLWSITKRVGQRSLATLLQERGPLDMQACLRIAEQIASALQYAHRRGIVHGDLRPGTIFMDDAGWAFLTGFAGARLIREAAARQGEPRGTAGAGYAAPEDAPQVPATPASDQYALAVIVHECLTGTRPVPNDTSLPAQLPGHVATALQRALSPVPADRYPSVSDFVSALSEAPPAAAPVPFERPALAQPEGREGGQRLLRVDRYRDPRTPRRIALSIAVLLALVVLYRVWRPPARPPAPQQIAQPRPTPANPVTEPVTPALDSVGDPARPTAVPRASRARTAREPGELFINSTPWGDVYLDDRLVGTTPLAGLKVNPGQHTVRIVRDGFQPYEQTISVAPGQRLRLVNIALQDLTP
jgi:serine/threonine protein kinase